MKTTPLCQHISYSEVAGVVDRFYRSVRHDALLADYFSDIENWPEHQRHIADFWWGLMGGTVENPRPHAMDSGHRELVFGQPELQQWLSLFEQTLQQSLAEDLARQWIALARQIGDRMVERGMLRQ